MTQPVNRLSVGLVVVMAVIAIGVLADGVVFVTHLGSAIHTTAQSTAQAEAKQPGQHPCNHGFYVSQAAHAKKGGGYVEQIAKSNLGKTGGCTAPLPAPVTPPKASSQQGDD